MAKLVPLFSSSKGNSYYIQSNDKALLIDAGRSCKQMELMMMRNGLSMKNVCGIFVTHEHIDHCAGLNVLAKRYMLPVYATKGTLEAMYDLGKIGDMIETHEINFDESVMIGGFEVLAVRTSHDARESCGFTILTPDERKISIITDTGIFKEDARLKAAGSDFLVIESNHDLKMLDEGPYPFVIKRRIRSANGHLSNDDCAKELPFFVRTGVKRILLAHLSEENNTKTAALRCAVSELDEKGYVNDVDYMIDAAPVESIGKSYSF